MNAFNLRDNLVLDYARYTRSFIKIRDERIKQRVDEALDQGELWPDPLLQLNPSFEPGGSIDELIKDGVLHKECSKIFRFGKDVNDFTGKPLFLHRHQKEAILKAKEDRSYVLTSGTGSGKSLTYIVPVVDHVLRTGTGRGIQAIVVYPMNALANSQDEELFKFLGYGYAEDARPVRWGRYTGQEKGEQRDDLRDNPPDILLTNYMMLELMLTRSEDRNLIRMAQGLKFLVFDELHTYRGRQGADVAMLIRRCRSAFNSPDMICVGTSATMASGGDSEDQKREVARVASTLYGTTIGAEQVINEFLERKTPELDHNDAMVTQAIAEAVKEQEAPPSNYEAFVQHPLASWIESTFGVETERSTGRLIRRKPRAIQGPSGAASELQRITSVDEKQCESVLRNYLMAGASLFPASGRPYPAFAFRLHQFFTRADTVWTTMEPEDVRHPEMSKQVSKPGEPEKLLYPLVFCRHCGAEYYRVAWRRGESGDRLFPREDRSQPDAPAQGEAYLYLSTKQPWPQDPDALLEKLPDFMKEEQPDGSFKIRRENKDDLPIPVNVTAEGYVVPEGQGLTAAVIMDNFLFCLGCGVAYNKNQRSERAKLNTLGVDNRSTATTVLAIRSLIELQGDRTLEKKARKLLSFTDNRQDASLQAGHFNDFAQVALLRSALYKASVAKAGQLDHANIAQAVYDELNLPFEEFAADPEVRGLARNESINALQRVITYYLYRDLKGGWRVTAPNLEDCGLLRFSYAGLDGPDGLLADEQIWREGLKDKDGNLVQVPLALAACETEQRREVLETLLDHLRRSLAVKAEALDPLKQQQLVESTKPRLQEGTVWYLDDARDLEKAKIAYWRPKRQGDQMTVHYSSYGGYGRFVRNKLHEYQPGGRAAFNRAVIDEHVQFLFRALRAHGLIEPVRDERSDSPGFQLNPACLRWVPGDGTERPVDKLRTIAMGETPPEANEYFVECYKHFADLKCVLEAREHTAQVSAEEREEREDKFRDADLPLLFCSPTMELGVDIAQLNVVNMRNVPPTPANYAQRSGRAGRSGQPALVYTYCAGRSPHDQYYFRQPGAMVAGVVAPPRIDLSNRDLIRSHVQALWLEVVKPDLGKTVNHVLDIVTTDGRIEIPLKDGIRTELRDPGHRAKAVDKAKALLASIDKEVLANATWYHEAWAEDVLRQVERSFDAACDRWRGLYRAATRQRELNHRIIIDLSRPEHEKEMAKRLRQQAESQIKLLTNAEGVFEGDFYSYRYFASEGFLPGYSFPRLPISAFIPARRKKRSTRDEFVSRPRFLAIAEFGPRALIYHEGARYQVDKVNLDYGTNEIEGTHALNTTTMKRCGKCGYAHVATGMRMDELCERCGDALDPKTMVQDMVQLQNVSLRLTKRITCDEEERQRFGYKVVTAYRFPSEDGRKDQKDADVEVNGARRMSLSYGDTASIYRINLGWKNQKPTEPNGFMINTETGFWARNQNEAKDNDDAHADGRQQRVVPFVNDTKNVLVMRMEPAPSKDVMACLESAMKEAILRAYQLEPRELVCEPMPSPADRQELLFYEASEGGAGVLRLFVGEDPKAMAKLARHALEVCHYDPDTLQEKPGTKCGKACYECLLDYGNQPDHAMLDRRLIKDLLVELMNSTVKGAGGAGSREERMAALRKQCDTKLEHRWLDFIDSLLLKPPSHAQFRIPDMRTQPDFYYKETNAAIYVDGPVHDRPDLMREDQEITDRLMDNGYIVVRFHHAADWNKIVKQHPDVFGEPHQSP